MAIAFCECTKEGYEEMSMAEEYWDLPRPQEGINPKDKIGMTKPSLRLVPPALEIQVSRAMAEGAAKYGPYNWRTGPPVQLTIYIEAAKRHLAALLDGEDIDPESGIPHAAKAAACMAIILDAGEIGQLKDDRVAPGPAGRLIAELSRGTKKE